MATGAAGTPTKGTLKPHHHTSKVLKRVKLSKAANQETERAKRIIAQPKQTRSFAQPILLPLAQ
jgi:hypothetical protein